MSELFRLIHAKKATHPIVLLCRVLKVARSSYYAWREGEGARRARQAADDTLAHEHIASRHTYGVPRIHAAWRRLGRRVNRKRVARLMRERDIRGVTRRTRRSLTRPDVKAKPTPDLIGRHFHAKRPRTKLVGDITYLPTAAGWLYVACWLDLATRGVVGYVIAGQHRAELVVDALDMAHGRGGLEPGCVFHCDRGSEATSAQFRERIGKFGLWQSSGRTGSCFDNAAAESFWALLKEEIGTRIWPDRATARAEVFNCIETFYNRRRLRKHKTCGYLTPGRDQAAASARPRGITITCPRSRGDVNPKLTHTVGRTVDAGTGAAPSGSQMLELCPVCSLQAQLPQFLHEVRRAPGREADRSLVEVRLQQMRDVGTGHQRSPQLPLVGELVPLRGLLQQVFADTIRSSVTTQGTFNRHLAAHRSSYDSYCQEFTLPALLGVRTLLRALDEAKAQPGGG
ncbi:IS3 family transposase [Streptomyces sp. NPDC127178]|uniref:IS3 family transposase n=1 Tax=unclassified Streptomyces TaxID=2593676 RepID=UPI003637ACE0